jgi:hypothetical protein
VTRKKKLLRQIRNAAIIKVPMSKVSLKLIISNYWKATSGMTVFVNLKQNFMIFSEGK